MTDIVGMEIQLDFLDLVSPFVLASPVACPSTHQEIPCMDLTFLSQADTVTLKLEIAKRALEAAKFDLENARQAHDEVLSQAESHGIPKAKLKKLTEDRVLALFDSGLLGAGGRAECIVTTAESKRERPKKGSKKPEVKQTAEEIIDGVLEETSFIEAEIESASGRTERTHA